MRLQELHPQGRNKEFAKIWSQLVYDEYVPNRKGSNAPYHTHPQTVEQIVDAYGGSNEESIAAHCHDIVEDTPISVSKIKDLYGEDVAEIVAELTNSKDLDGMKKEDYMNKKLIYLSPEALTVKIADMLHNLLDKPRKEQVERMNNNIQFLKRNRKITKEIHQDLVDAFESGYELFKAK